MWKLRSGAILATVAGLAAGSAQAADLYEPEVVMPPPAEPVYVEPAPEVGVSWYIRGDVGYSVNELRGVHFMQGTGAPHVADVSFTSSRLDNSWMVGGGVGAAVATDDDGRKGDVRYREGGDRHRSSPSQFDDHFCPPGQAKKGRC